MKRYTLYSHLLITGVLLVAAGCREQQEGSQAPDQNRPEATQIQVTPAQFNRNSMSLGKVLQMDFPETLEVNGSIDVPPENRAVVSAVTGGFVKSISLLVGDTVKRGELIVALESPEFLKLQQAYMEAGEELPFLEAEYNRQKTLYEEQISSEKLFLQAQSEYRTTLARYHSLEEQLALLNIPADRVASGNLTSLSRVLAPISGSITQVNVRKGAYVSPATEIAEIIDNSHLHLELNVYEKDISRLEKDQLIRFRVPEFSAEEYRARVYLIGSSIGKDRTVKVHAHLSDEANPGFLVGMYVRATIELPQSEEEKAGAVSRMAVPESAVVVSQGQAYVLILEEQNPEGYFFRQVPVESGRVSDGYVAISGDGVTASGEILTEGAFNLIRPE